MENEQVPATTPPEAIIEMLMLAMDMRSMDLASHCVRVSELSGRIGQTLGLSAVDLAALRRGTLLHDIGRMATPEKFTFREDEQSEEAWTMLRRHPENGARLMRKIPALADTIQVVLFHHERWDGTGYPAKLGKEKIPLLARICAAADAYDGMVNDPVKSRAWPRLRAMTAIEEGSSTAYDPAVVKALIKVVD
jgi:putative nucleotidyltransferase with HDIG domain